ALSGAVAGWSTRKSTRAQPRRLSRAAESARIRPFPSRTVRRPCPARSAFLLTAHISRGPRLIHKSRLARFDIEGKRLLPQTPTPPRLPPTYAAALRPARPKDRARAARKE